MQRPGSRLRWSMRIRSQLRRFSALHCSKRFLRERRNSTNEESSMMADTRASRMEKAKDQSEKKTRRVTEKPPNPSVCPVPKAVRRERVRGCCHEPKLLAEMPCTRPPRPMDPPTARTNQWTLMSRRTLTQVPLLSHRNGEQSPKHRFVFSDSGLGISSSAVS